MEMTKLHSDCICFLAAQYRAGEHTASLDEMPKKAAEAMGVTSSTAALVLHDLLEAGYLRLTATLAGEFTLTVLESILSAEESARTMVRAEAAEEKKNITDHDRWTLLHWAARRGYTKIVKFLLSRKANVNAKDKDGRTPLHWAAQKGRKKVAELLLANTADVNAKDNHGKTPLRTVLDHPVVITDLVDLLRQHCGKE